MPLIRVTDAAAWDGFISAQPKAQFTQSWTWGEFRRSLGQRVERVALTDAQGAWEAAAMLFHVAKPVVGGYWYAQRGPVLRADRTDAITLTRFIDALTEQGLPAAALFWRIEPPLTRSMSPDVPAPLIRSHAYMPASTLLIDLAHSEEELLKVMHEKTRYNIRVAERHGVTVRVATEPEAINAFLRLNDETATRDGFVSQPSSYIRKTFEALSASGMVHLRFAEKDGVLLAASFEINYGDTVTYLYGASSSTDRKTMAPYALHWDAIKAAKSSGALHHMVQGGARWYDFHGVNPLDAASPYFKKSWEGITRFKRGWGGTSVDYVGTFELPRMPLLYHVFR
jgi:peptidoglycan pentaglycine glycine transferase (the first glycine)